MSLQEIVQKNNLLQCIQCGICTGSCPIAVKTSLNIRKYMREAAVLRRLIIRPQNEVWGCTTCGTCSSRCPKQLKPYEFLVDIRSIVVEKGEVAPTIRDALESVYLNGNPWGRGRGKRVEWARDLNVRHISQGVDVLYYVGCTTAYDPRVQNIARSLVKSLSAANLSFGVLGEEENCCGSEVYHIGEKGLFEFLVEENMKLFSSYSVKQIVTNCPHGLDVFKNRYPKESDLEVWHHSQLLARLIDEGKLSPSKRVDKRVIYHDPCYLGKRNKIFEEPRKVIESIKGITLLEFDRSRNRSLCCEGGGGRMWFDVPGPRLAELRVKEAVEVGADIIAVACPFCMLTMEDAVKTTGNEEKIQVMDIAELLALAL
ncbi:MAG: (Fe-S)-binding protein [Candidatus Nezhaarchaeales archaeon]